MQICKQCGHENDDQAVFCTNPNCGTFLQWTADDEAGTRIEGASAASTPVGQADLPRGPRRRPPVEGSPQPRPVPVAGQPTDVPPDTRSTAPAEPSAPPEAVEASARDTESAPAERPPGPEAAEAVQAEPPEAGPPAVPDGTIDLTGQEAPAPSTAEPPSPFAAEPPSSPEPPAFEPPDSEPPPSVESTGPRPARPGAPRSPLSPSPTLASGEGEDATAQSRITRARFLAARPGESRSAPQQTLVMEERPSAGVTVSISPTECNVAPGESASCEILVRNTGTVVDQFTLQVEGDAAVWAVVEPPALNLYPGSEPGVSTLRFFPPRSPQTASGPARFALRATSREDPSVSATARGVLNVAPYYDLAAELMPQTSQGRRRAEHRFLVNNQGNTRMRAAVNATDPDNLLRFNVTPSTLSADPGTDASATLQVRPQKLMYLGNTLVRPFEVTGVSEGAPALRAQGQFQQVAFIPRWVPRVALLVLPFLVALIAYLVLTANVPAVAGQTTDQASALLTKAGFKPQAATFADNATVPIGHVISTSPSGGRHRKHSPVGMLLSSGIPLPNLGGQDAAAARSALESKGLVVDTQQVTNKAPMGQVIGTTPPNGSVSKGDHVALLISTGIPTLMASPNSVTMPGQAVNSTSAPLAVTIANGGTGPLTVSSVALGGANATDFAIANNGCMGASVAPQGSCPVQLTFTPTAAGARNAVLTIASNAPEAPPVTLSGTGLVSDIGLGATAINFGDQKVGTQSPAQTIAVTNKGTAPMKMGATTAIGTNANEFALTDGCKDNTVAPGAGCSIGVVFMPAGAGARSAKLTVANDSGLSQNVTLSGNGTAPMVITVPNPATGLTFTEANKPQEITIINQGTAPLALGQVTVVGVPPEVGRRFQAVPACGGQLPPNGGSCKVAVTYIPAGLTDTLTCAKAALVISDELGQQKIPMVWKSADPIVCNLTDILSSLGNSP